MCCEQQETRKPEGQPDPPLFTVLSAEVSISCPLPVNTKRSISQICRLEELFHIMKHFVCVLKPVPIVDDLKKKKNTGYDRRLDCTSFKPFRPFCFEDVPIKQILFHSLSRNENMIQHTPGKLAERASNGQQHRELIL